MMHNGIHDKNCLMLNVYRLVLCIFVLWMLRDALLLRSALLGREKDLVQLFGCSVGPAPEALEMGLLLYGLVILALGLALLPLIRLFTPALRRVSQPLLVALVGHGLVVSGREAAPRLHPGSVEAPEGLAYQTVPGGCTVGAQRTGGGTGPSMEVWDLEREQVTRRQWKFALEMSKEIRTQVLSVLGLIELLQSGRLSEIQRGFADSARFIGEKELSTSNDIINLMGISVGHLEALPEVFQVRALADEIIDTFSETARRKGVDLVCQVSSNVPHLLAGDRWGLGLVLTHLVENALELTDSGRISLSLCCPQVPQGEDTVMMFCEVRDTGTGLPAEVQARVFGKLCAEDLDPSGQLLEVEPRLRLTRKLLELMGSHLALATRAGGGSTFWFKVPLLKVKAPAPAPQPITDLVREPGASVSPRVLIAGVDYQHQTLCLAVLESRNCQTTVVATGAAALLRLSHQQFDLVILDCAIPSVEFAQRMRPAAGDTSCATQSYVPIIVLASHDILLRNRRKWSAAGVDGWLVKPFTSEELARALGKWLPESIAVTGGVVPRPPAPSVGRSSLPGS